MTRRLAGALPSAAAILLAAVVLGLVANAVSGTGVPLVAESAPPGRTIELAAARRLLADGGARFIDVRPREDFVAGHIAGAISVPYEERVGRLDSLRRALPRTQPLVVYCGGGECDAARAASVWLAGDGWRDVRLLRGGYAVWEAAGFPVSAGDGP